MKARLERVASHIDRQFPEIGFQVDFGESQKKHRPKDAHPTIQTETQFPRVVRHHGKVLQIHSCRKFENGHLAEENRTPERDEISSHAF